MKSEMKRRFEYGSPDSILIIVEREIWARSVEMGPSDQCADEREQA